MVKVPNLYLSNPGFSSTKACRQWKGHTLTVTPVNSCSILKGIYLRIAAFVYNSKMDEDWRMLKSVFMSVLFCMFVFLMCALINICKYFILE